jgi:polyisoprenoid-binding protein YceI
MRHALLASILLLSVFTIACGGSSNTHNTTLNEAQNVEKPTGDKAGAEVKFSNDGSSVEWTGRKVTGKHEGGFSKFSGNLTLDKEGKNVTYAFVEIEIDSIWADNKEKTNADLTKHLKSDVFFDAEKFPKGKFETTKIEKKGDKYDITGNLTLRDVTKSITFPADISVGEKEVSVKAAFNIDRIGFGVKFPGMKDNAIEDKVDIRLDIHAKR